MYDIECCGTHQKQRGMPSMRSPPNHQLLIASMLRSRTAPRGAPRSTRRSNATVPSALDATVASVTPAAAANACGTAVHAARNSVETRSSAVPTAFTFRSASTFASWPGPVPAIAAGAM